MASIDILKRLNDKLKQTMKEQNKMVQYYKERNNKSLRKILELQEQLRLERDVDSAKDTLDNLVLEIEQLEALVESLQKELEEKDDIIEELQNQI